MQYRKKPVIIEAIQWTGANVDEILGLTLSVGSVRQDLTSTSSISIDTLEGTMRADKNDWIIKGVKGELYPCKPDIFDITYEQV